MFTTITTVLEKYLSLLLSNYQINFHENADTLEIIKISYEYEVFSFTSLIMTTMMSKMMKTMRAIPVMDATAP